jgi:hypothetical protein
MQNATSNAKATAKYNRITKREAKFSSKSFVKAKTKPVDAIAAMTNAHTDLNASENV